MKIILMLLLFTSITYAGTCYVKVTSPDGKPLKGVKVQACINNTFTKDVFTNQNGEVLLTWNGEKDIHHVYIDGKKYGSCKNKGSFVATKAKPKQTKIKINKNNSKKK